MKVSIPTQALVEAVAHAAAVAANKSPKPILECVAFHADPKTGLSLEATDLDVALRYHLPDADVSEGGSLVVPAGRLLSITREIQEETTTLLGVEGGLSVDTGRSHFQVRGEPADEFPNFPSFPDSGSVALPSALAQQLIKRTAFATAKEAGRFALHGVQMRIHGSELEMVATDGRRLARASGVLGAKSKNGLDAIVGPKGLHLLERILAAGAQEVELAVEERQVMFRAGPALIISRLIDGTFPSLDGVIPKKTTHAFTSTAAEFAAGLRQASLLTTRDAMSVELHVETNTLVIRSRARDVGEAKVEVPVAYEGEPHTMGFNPVFLQDALKVMEPASEVRFEFNDAKSPGTLTDRDDYTYVVMPIALE